jgi:hypothetical protein
MVSFAKKRADSSALAASCVKVLHTNVPLDFGANFVYFLFANGEARRSSAYGPESCIE